MSKRPVCRACLVDNLTMYRVTESPYEEAYEKLSNAKLGKGNLPETFCYMCVAMLRKFQKFAALTQESNVMLEQWYKNEIDCKPKNRLQFKISTTTVEYITSKFPDPELAKDVKIKIEPDEPETINQVQFIEFTNETDPYVPEETTDVNIETADVNMDTTDVNMEDSLVKDDDSWPDADQKPEAASDDDFEPPVVKQEPKKRAVSEKTPKGGPANKKFKSKPIKSEKQVVTLTLEKESKLQENVTKTSLRKKFTCNICKKQYTSRDGLRLHERSHNNANCLQCDYCDEKFKNRVILKRHNRDVHRNKTPLLCKICNFEGFNENDLISHRMTHHTRYKEVICDFCGFNTRGGKACLVIHIKRRHIDDKPMSCDICDYRCVDKILLKDHYNRVHTNKYLCHICDYRCAKRERFELHLEIHKKKNEKNYRHSCSVCGRKFLEKRTLTNHFRIHTGEKPNACTICGRKFNQKSALRTHTRRVHNIK